MRWQTEAYYESQRRTLRPATFARLHRNEWVSSESRFIESEVYDACVESGLREDLTDSLFVGVDGRTEYAVGNYMQNLRHKDFRVPNLTEDERRIILKTRKK
jgi:hypothetical protein